MYVCMYVCMYVYIYIYIDAICNANIYIYVIICKNDPFRLDMQQIPQPGFLSETLQELKSAVWLVEMGSNWAKPYGKKI